MTILSILKYLIYTCIKIIKVGNNITIIKHIYNSNKMFKELCQLNQKFYSTFKFVFNSKCQLKSTSVLIKIHNTKFNC